MWGKVIPNDIPFKTQGKEIQCLGVIVVGNDGVGNSGKLFFSKTLPCCYFYLCMALLTFLINFYPRKSELVCAQGATTMKFQ